MKLASRSELEEIVKPLVRENAFIAFKKVDRKLFVPIESGEQAYLDTSIPLGKDSSISQPSLVAEMIDLLDLKGDEKVLEIGTGSGYSSAILSLCCEKVYTIEMNKDLAEKAKEKLKKYKNIKIYIGNGLMGIASKAPFDAILINAAVRKFPKILIDQLVDSGRIVVPIEGVKSDSQMLYVYLKTNGKIFKKSVFPVRFVMALEKL